DARRIGRHPDLQVGRKGRRDPGHRRQPDRRPPGVRLAHEEAPAPGRAPDRHRSAPHRPGQVAAHPRRLPLAAAARHQRRDDQRAGP
ncbi:hypothetical protein LTR94_037115, partial [Friedmanniomyces endolithicus]